MTKIKLSDYTIEADGHGINVKYNYIGKDKNDHPKPHTTQIGAYSKSSVGLTQALTAITRHSVANMSLSEGEMLSLEQFKKHITLQEEEVKKWVMDAIKEWKR
ncbi:MAG: hypothetical protein GY861_20450 [bacterium]|nr:hypothetical protein [bacterium]